MIKPSGVWLPIITPFYEDRIDFDTLEGLINHYLPKGIAGLIVLGTTGEIPTVSEKEFEEIMDFTLRVVNSRLPVFMGVGGNNTRNVLKILKKVESYPVDGILSVCPYYNRPSQQGLYEHFLKISESTSLPIIIYNIPYRTGVNLSNDTLLELARQSNIVGVKDSCGKIKQSLSLLGAKPDDFAVLTGEDLLFYTTLVNGGDGGILAAAHLMTEIFVEVFECVKNNDHLKALSAWRRVEPFIPLLFKEPNPAPLKYLLSCQGLLRSQAVRAPLSPITSALQTELDDFV